jgi:ribonuclease III
MTEAGQERGSAFFGHKFLRPAWLERALTHSSWIAENPEPERESTAAGNAAGDRGVQAAVSFRDNERLEFLGDAVLTLVVSEALLKSFPQWREGQLSKARASLVNATALADAARRLDLGAHLRLGKGEERTGGREKPALLADAYEAVIAAIFLDGGLEPAQRFVEQTLISPALAEHESRGALLGQPDHKSRLQELLQARGRPAAKYHVVRESGPAHRKVFEVEARVAEFASAVGTGMSKKQAEQAAARGVLELLSSSGAGEGNE